MAKLKTMIVDKGIETKLLEYANNEKAIKVLDQKKKKLTKANKEIFKAIEPVLKVDVSVILQSHVFKVIKSGNESVPYKEVVQAILSDLAASKNTKLLTKYEALLKQMTKPAGSKTELSFIEVQSVK